MKIVNTDSREIEAMRLRAVICRLQSAHDELAGLGSVLNEALEPMQDFTRKAIALGLCQSQTAERLRNRHKVWRRTVNAPLKHE